MNRQGIESDLGSYTSVITQMLRVCIRVCGYSRKERLSLYF